ncbi:MAG: TRAM domain-containing protein, partial [Verrucomicrobiota bacterium]|nr:TRAM domain-containing protein [Verrucomicrobiota bacterium]
MPRPWPFPGGLAKRNTVLSDAATTTAKEEITRPEVGQRITVRIDDVAFGGEGVGRVDGFVVFVP